MRKINASLQSRTAAVGGEAAVDSPNDTSERADHEHHARTAPSKAAPLSCCCGATKDRCADNSKSRDAPSK